MLSSYWKYSSSNWNKVKTAQCVLNYYGVPSPMRLSAIKMPISDDTCICLCYTLIYAIVILTMVLHSRYVWNQQPCQEPLFPHWPPPLARSGGSALVWRHALHRSCGTCRGRKRLASSCPGSVKCHHCCSKNWLHG